MLQGHDIVCLANSHWDGHMTSKHQIMLRLAENNRVLYVNRAMSILSPLTGWDEIPLKQQLKEAFQGPRQISANLFVVSPPILLPFRFHKFTGVFNNAITIAWLRRVTRKLGMSNPIFWTIQPESGAIVGKLGERISIYHCVDEHSATRVSWTRPDTVEDRERELIRSVNAVITTSRDLHRRKAKFNANCYFVPHGVNFELFSRARDAETQVPPELAKLRKPVIGYIGMLSPAHFDVDCVEYIARKSGYEIVIIGRKIGRFSMASLERLPNVHFMGFKEPIELPGYLKGIDVCTMPRIKSKLLEAVFPLKLFEYLAAGKPIVATKTNELSCYGDLVSLVDTPEEFLEAIDRELHDDTPEKIIDRVAAAKANTWDVRIEALSALIEKHLHEKEQSSHCNDS